VEIDGEALMEKRIMEIVLPSLHIYKCIIAHKQSNFCSSDRASKYVQKSFAHSGWSKRHFSKHRLEISCRSASSAPLNDQDVQIAAQVP